MPSTPDNRDFPEEGDARGQGLEREKTSAVTRFSQPTTGRGGQAMAKWLPRQGAGETGGPVLGAFLN